MDTKDLKILNSDDIYKIAEKYNQEQLKKIFKKDTFYSYNDFKQHIINNMDKSQYGGKEKYISGLIKTIFSSFFNKYKTEKQNKDILLPSHLSEETFMK